MARAGAWHADPKKVTGGYVYHWKTPDGWDRSFRDKELLTVPQQIARVKELKRGWQPIIIRQFK